MKKILSLFVAIAATAMLTSVARAEDKAVTITGKGVCAKCELKQASACQNAIVVEKDGKSTTYLLEANDVSKAFHKNVCKAPMDKVTATGTVKKDGDKMVLVATKVEAAK